MVRQAASVMSEALSVRLRKVDLVPPVTVLNRDRM
jgi:hypothetical protein